MPKAISTALLALSAASAGLDRADSLCLFGTPGQAEAELLRLSAEPALRTQVLYRLVGLYHSRGMERAGSAVLDSLAASWGTDLDGWRISLLDLGGLDAEASVLAAGDPYLLLFLSCRDSLPPGPAPSRAPSSAPEALLRLAASPPGTLSAEQAKLCADLAPLFPEARTRLARELAKRPDMPKDQWDSLIAALEASGAREQAVLLRLGRMGATGELDESFAESCLATPGQVAASAALLLESRGGAWGRSWRVCDALAEGGFVQAAASMAAGSADPVFVEGVMMAVSRASGQPGLLDLCDSARSRGVDSLSARAMLFRARALRDAGRTAEAWRAYTDFASANPSHPSAHEAAFLAGRYYDSELMWPEAAAAYSAALRTSGEGRYDESSYWRGGFSLLAAGRPGEALALWEEGCRCFPWGFWHDEMLYWRARTAGWNAPGSSVLLQEAAETHPWEYYGMRAAARLGRDPSWSPPFPSVEIPPLAVDLVSSGYARLAGSMLRHASTPDTLERVQALGLLGMHPAAISLCGALDSRMRYSGAGVVPEEAALFQFPAPYRELAGSACSGLSLPPALVMGIIREESSFDREARSSAGARGLIQLMPGTASDVARWYGLPALQGDDFHDPGSSVRYGSLYINRQWGAFAGELPLVLAAYNAGPGNASRWRELLGYQSGDADWFTERITFRETREYVKRVTRSSWIYGRFFQ